MLDAPRPRRRVVTVFTGGPNDPGVLTWRDAQSGATSPDERISQRIEENDAALGVFDARAINLGAVEGQYGGGEAPTLDEVLIGASIVYVPAGSGIPQNGEHVAVRDADSGPG